MRSDTGAGASASTTTFTTFGTTNRGGVGSKMGAGGKAGAKVAPRTSDMFAATAPSLGAFAQPEAGPHTPSPRHFTCRPSQLCELWVRPEATQVMTPYADVETRRERVLRPCGEVTVAADWTLPPIVMERRARTQNNRYVDVARQMDESAAAEDRRKKEAAKERAAAIKAHLDTQVAFRDKQRAQRAEEFVRDKADIVSDLMKLEGEQVAKAAKVASTVARESKERAQQVEANRKRLARTAAEAGPGHSFPFQLNCQPICPSQLRPLRLSPLTTSKMLKLS